MRLDSLIIINNFNDTEIRNIKFNKYGLSLICDDDNLPGQYSGSSIGKTAFVRCIDICLGANSTKTLYKNKSTGGNPELEKYLKENKVSLKLIIILNNGKRCVLERNLYNNSEYIDGEKFENIRHYCDKLKEMVFPNSNKNISFREMMTKFIRIDNNDQIFKYNGQFTNAIKYRYSYYYFLNLFIDEKESELNNEFIEKKNEISRLKNIYNITDDASFKQLVDASCFEMSEAKNRIVKNDYVESFSNVDEKNIQIIEEMDILTNLIYQKRHKLDVLKKKIVRENEKIVSIDVDVLRALYDDSIEMFRQSNASFESFMLFHNEMCNLRKEAYNKEINDLEEEIYLHEIELKEIRQMYIDLFTDFKIKTNENSNDFYDNYYELKQIYSKTLNDYNKYVKLKIEIEKIEKDLANINDNKKSNDSNKDIIIKLFRAYSAKFLGTEYTLIFDDKIDSFPIYADGIGGNLGTGDTNAIMCALDFSFYDFFVEKSLDLPFFIIHDRMETTPLISLSKIFSSARKNKIQYILPILHDRIEDLGVKEEEIILHLSKKEKLFKL